MLYCHIDIICDTVGCDRPVLRDVLIHVIPKVADKWYELGLILLEPKYENHLKTIEADSRNDARTCCRKVFEEWLRTDTLASWDKVIESLALIGLDNVASDIKQLLGLQGEYKSRMMTQWLAKLLLCNYQSISVLRIPLDSRARLSRGNQNSSLVTVAYFP